MSARDLRTVAVGMLGLVLLTANCAPTAPTNTPPLPQAASGVGAPTPASGATTPTPTEETPRRGGILTISTAADPPSFDIQQETSISALQPVAPAYNMLVMYDPKHPNQIIGDLAESWTVSSDGLTYTFTLTPGITFHDGQPMTVDDVLFSLQRMADPPKGIRSGRKEQFAALSKFEKVDDKSLRVVFKQPYASFLSQFATDWFVIHPKHIVENQGDMRTTILGTGPFKYKSYSPGVSLEYVRFDRYFKKDLPYLDGITTHIIKDRATRLAALRTGRVLITGRIFAALTPSEAQTLAKELPNLVLMRSPGLSSSWFVFSTKRKPFDDVRVRRAISIAFDRDMALKVLGEGEGTVGSFMPPGEWSFTDAELRQMPGYRISKDADIAQAKQLLADAGYPNGFAVPSGVLVRDLTQNSGVFWADQLSRIGISAKLDVVETTTYTQRTTRHDFVLSVSSNAFRINDPDELGRKYLTGSAQSYGDYSDAEVDRLFAEQSSILDPSKRKEVVLQLVKRLEETAPAISPYWENSILGLWPQVRGFAPPIGSFMLNRYESVWLFQ